MTAGLNQVARIYRYDYEEDDYVGGANPTGTMLYENISVRIEPVAPTMALLEQGLETVKLFRTLLAYPAVGVKENDEVEVFLPRNSIYFNQRFRIISVEHPSMSPSGIRGYLRVTMRRRDEAHLRTD